MVFDASVQSEQQQGRPLPKFGEWDVNDPASAEGFTVIFNKARDEKKMGASGRMTSQRRYDSRRENGKSKRSSKVYIHISRFHSLFVVNISAETIMIYIVDAEKVVLLWYLSLDKHFSWLWHIDDSHLICKPRNGTKKEGENILLQNAIRYAPRK